MITFQFDPFPYFNTDRLVMRKITAEDTDAFFQLRTDPVVNRYIDRDMMKTKDEAYALIQKLLKELENNESIIWAITTRENNTMIGNICFWNISREHHKAEIGYVLSAEYHRKGLMDEAVKKVLEYGFTFMKLHSVQANVNPNNIASIKLLEKNGFVKEAHFRENYFYNGRFLDTAIYSLLAPVSGNDRFEKGKLINVESPGQ
jgi:ribosomal-protein-alanine N-acetyltransferase